MMPNDCTEIVLYELLRFAKSEDEMKWKTSWALSLSNCSPAKVTLERNGFTAARSGDLLRVCTKEMDDSTN